jgi:rhodanese-related sulfurtransferase
MKKLLLMTIVAVMAIGCSGSKKTEQAQNPQNRVTILCVNDFDALVQSKRMRVIDVRTRSEYNEGHIAGAENIDINQTDFVERVRLKDETIAVYCRTGKRSQKAALMLAEQGAYVYDLGGVLHAWQQAGRPTVK